MLGVPPLVAHFFVFYYGVLADITPPVALAAYAGASMAGADPFKTGNTAFRLGLAKALVPFVFVYSPAMLLVTKGFTWAEFFETDDRLRRRHRHARRRSPATAWRRVPAGSAWLAGLAALPTIAPGLASTLLGLLAATPVILGQILRAQRLPKSAAA